MSTTIDERVVEMRFDNSQFEKNVSTSMSTLAKLKQSLNLTGASKGLENINSATKNFNMSGMGNAIDTVHAKFSALEVMGMTALVNITNSAVNAGKRMVKSLTIDPVKTGLQEYETQINAVQTILANTQSKGSTLKDVNAALDELNTYADKTIYNFTEMTKNIGTFTAAGVDLDKSVTSIKGIANLAAVSGSTSQQASTAMYQLSQALAAGKVSLMDWNSVVNAGMGGQVFQDALKRTATQMGYNVDAIIKKYGSFRESLTKGEWLTTEVLTETLTQLSGAYSKADLIAQGYTEKQANEIISLANTAEDAATKVKTFTQLFDVIKEAAQSGWTQTWELIIGDYEQAKSLLSPLAEFLTNIINKTSEFRNKILEGALASPFAKLADKIEKVSGATTKMSEVTKDYGDVVNKVINGEFGNGQSRWDKLAKAGYDWAKVQNMVNEKLGDSTRHTEQLTKAQKDQNGTQSTSIEQLVKMSDAQLKSLGFTKSEIEAFRELQTQSEKTGIPINKLMKDLDQLDGRTLLINSFKNAGKGLITVIESIRKAWRQTFHGDASEEEIIQKKTEQLYNMIAAIHKFSTKLKVNADTADKLTRTFKGLFAIIDLITTITGGGLKIAFKAITSLLDMADVDILSLTASIGDAIVGFRDWVDSSLDFTKVFKKIAPYLKELSKGIREWINDLKEADNIPEYIIQGLVNGLKNGGQMAIDAIVNLGKDILKGIKEVLGIHSPSTEFFEIGKNIIQGLINGVIEGAGNVVSFFKNLGGMIIDAFSSSSVKTGMNGVKSTFVNFFNGLKDIVGNFDFGTVFALAISGGLIFVVKKLSDVLEMFGSPLKGLGDMFEGITNVLNSFSKVIKAKAFEVRAEGILKLAKAIGILAVSVFLLASLELTQLGKAVGVIAGLALILAGLAFACDKLSSSVVNVSKKGINFKGLNTTLISLAASLFIMAKTVKMIGTMDSEQAKQGFYGLAGMIAALIVFLGAYGAINKFLSTDDIDKVGKVFFKLAASLLVLAIVAKVIGSMDPAQAIQGFVGIVGLMGAMIGFIALYGLVTKKLGTANIEEAGKMLFKLSVSLLILVVVAKLINTMTWGEMGKAAVGLVGLVGVVALIVKVVKTIGSDVPKIASTLLGLSVALGVLVLVAKLINTMTWGEMGKAAVGLVGLVGVVALLVKIVDSMGNDAPKIAATLLAMSVALGILAAIAIVLSLVNLKGLIKGVAAITVLGLVMSGMIKATRGANDCKGNLIVMTVAIAILTAAVVTLSMIKPDKLFVATTAISVLMAMFAKIAKSSSSLNGSMGSLIAMTAAVAVLGGVVYLLSTLPIESVFSTCVSLSLVLSSIALAMKLMGSAGSSATAAIPALGALVIAIGLLTAVFWAIDALNIDVSLETATSLSTLLLAMAGVCKILSTVGAAASGAVMGAVALDGVIIVIGALIVGLAALVQYFPALEEFLDKGITILGKIGTGIGTFVGNIIGAFAEGVTSSLPEIGTNLSNFMNNLQPFIQGIKQIDETAMNGMMSLVKMMAAITGNNIMESISQFLTGNASMDTFATQLEGFADAIIAFSNKVKGNIDESSVTAAASAGKMLSEMQSNIQGVGGVFQFFTGEKNLSQFGLQIQAFGDAIVKFSNTVKGKVDETAVTAAANAGKVMATMQNKIAPSGGVFQFFTGEKNMSEFGTQLTAFGSAIVQFSSTVSGEGTIDEKAVKAAASAGKIMASMQENIVPSGGVVQFFTGERNMSEFGTQLVDFGNAITTFSKTISGEGTINEEAIASAANAGKLMASMQADIVPSGGVISLFTGEQSMEDFGDEIVAFGEAIVKFSSTVSGKIDSGGVTAAANAGTIMAKLQEAIPEDHWFDGKVSLQDFGSDIADFGGYIADYGEEVADVNVSQIASSITAAERLVSLANTLTTLDADSVKMFDVEGIGKAIKAYADKVADIDPSVVSSSISSANRLVTLVRSLVGLDTSGIKSFKVDSIGEAMKKYSEKVQGISSLKIASSITSATRLVGLIKSMVGLNSSGVSTFTKAVNNLGKVNLDGLVKAFSNASTKMISSGSNLITSLTKGMTAKQGSVNKAATTIVSDMLKNINGRKLEYVLVGATFIAGIADGISKNKAKITTAVSSMVNDCITKAYGYYTGFYTAGSYLVTGFANGISANSYKAKAKAKAMAKAAKEAAEDALGIHSPSRVFYGIGDYAGQGFVNALGDYVKKAYDASSDVANSAKEGLGNAIARVADVINSDMDVQPTIRPVIDLSDVRAGAGAINGMFGQQLSIGASADISGGISAAMNQGQNGTNDDIVSAINKLRKDLGNVGNTSYNISGITYDDGSNVSDAVKSLVRAAKIGRRV